MSKPTESSELRPFRAELPQADLDDLQARLARVRWPDELPGAAWRYGVPLEYVRELVEHWRTGFDWRDHEARLNAHPQFTTTIDGQSVHFIHVRSPEPDALALICTHGWPMSVFEYLDLIGPLSDPRAYDGDPADAFHLVIPSVPGVAFSGPTTGPGWDTRRIARAWVELMAASGLRALRRARQRRRLADLTRGRPPRPGAGGRGARHPALLLPLGRPGRVRRHERGRPGRDAVPRAVHRRRRPRLQRLSVRPTADAGLRAAGLARRLAGLGDPALPALARAGRHPDARLRLLADQHHRLVHPALLRGGPRQPAADGAAPPPRPASRSSPRTSSRSGASPTATTPTSSAGTATSAAATSRPTTPPTSCSTTSAASSARCAERPG